jgi:hypothetical protein
VWKTISPGILEHLSKNEFPLTEDEVAQLLIDPEGDELLVLTAEGQYQGFVTFKIEEDVATIGMVYLKHPGGLKLLSEVLTQFFRERECSILRFVALRHAFESVAPKLGFHPRVTEFVKEI